MQINPTGDTPDKTETKTTEELQMENPTKIQSQNPRRNPEAKPKETRTREDLEETQSWAGRGGGSLLPCVFPHCFRGAAHGDQTIYHEHGICII